MNKLRLLQKSQFFYTNSKQHGKLAYQGVGIIMKRRIAMGILAVLLLSACGNSIQSDNTMEQGRSNRTTETAAITNSGGNSGVETTHPVPKELETIPETYYPAIDDQGSLVELDYNTYESKTYEQKTQKLEKGQLFIFPMVTAKIRNTMYFI